MKTRIILTKSTYYYKYVDDIFCKYDENDRKINIFKKYPKNIYPNLKFTSELEQNNSLNYVDLTITKANQTFDFVILYTNLTQTNLTIHATSHHHMNHKLAAYNSNGLYIHYSTFHCMTQLL